MTAIERIQQFLKSRRGEAFCDDHLSVLLDIRPRQQVEQKTKKLEQMPGFDRRIQLCAGGGETNKLAICATKISSKEVS